MATLSIAASIQKADLATIINLMQFAISETITVDESDTILIASGDTHVAAFPQITIASFMALMSDTTVTLTINESIPFDVKQAFFGGATIVNLTITNNTALPATVRLFLGGGV